MNRKMRRKTRTIIGRCLAPDEERWRDWIIGQMTEPQKKAFYAAGMPIDPRPFVGQDIAAIARMKAENGEFATKAPAKAKERRPKLELVAAKPPGWFERMLTAALIRIRERRTT